MPPHSPFCKCSKGDYPAHRAKFELLRTSVNERRFLLRCLNCGNDAWHSGPYVIRYVEDYLQPARATGEGSDRK